MRSHRLNVPARPPARGRFFLGLIGIFALALALFALHSPKPVGSVPVGSVPVGSAPIGSAPVLFSAASETVFVSLSGSSPEIQPADTFSGKGTIDPLGCVAFGLLCSIGFIGLVAKCKLKNAATAERVLVRRDPSEIGRYSGRPIREARAPSLYQLSILRV